MDLLDEGLKRSMDKLKEKERDKVRTWTRLCDSVTRPALPGLSRTVSCNVYSDSKNKEVLCH